MYINLCKEIKFIHIGMTQDRRFSCTRVKRRLTEFGTKMKLLILRNINYKSTMFAPGVRDAGFHLNFDIPHIFLFCQIFHDFG